MDGAPPAASGSRRAARAPRAQPERTATVVELVIDSLAAGGDGVGRAPDGRVLFVPFTAPGDRVRVAVVEQHARFARGRVEALLEAGPGRVASRCPVFGQCGGCAWQHLDYAVQVEAKRRILAAALERIGHLERSAPIDFVASPAPYAYRSRARLLVRDGRVGYRRRRSHALCPTTRCPLLVPELEARLGELASRAPGEWELAVGTTGEVRAAPLPPGRGRRGRVALEVEGERIGVSAGVFFQANRPLLATLAAAVVAAAGRGRSAVELFAGAGFLTLPLARRFERVLAVEAQPAAVADLRRNLRAAQLTNVEVARGRVEAVLRRLAGERPDVVVLDPPRSGLTPDAMRALLAVGAPRLVYLSCDPATLARDLARLARAGLHPTRVTGFDLFPQTPHVETLALIERAGGAQVRAG